MHRTQYYKLLIVLVSIECNGILKCKYTFALINTIKFDPCHCSVCCVMHCLLYAVTLLTVAARENDRRVHTHRHIHVHISYHPHCCMPPANAAVTETLQQQIKKSYHFWLDACDHIYMFDAKTAKRRLMIRCENRNNTLAHMHTYCTTYAIRLCCCIYPSLSCHHMCC